MDDYGPHILCFDGASRWHMFHQGGASQAGRQGCLGIGVLAVGTHPNQFTNANWWHTTIRDLPDQTEHEFTLPLPLLYFIKPNAAPATNTNMNNLKLFEVNE